MIRDGVKQGELLCKIAAVEWRVENFKVVLLSYLIMWLGNDNWRKGLFQLLSFKQVGNKESLKFLRNKVYQVMIYTF